MSMTERIKNLAVSGSAEADVSAAAREEGMLTLRSSGLRKVKEGITSVDEVVRETVK